MPWLLVLQNCSEAVVEQRNENDLGIGINEVPNVRVLAGTTPGSEMHSTV